jgi:hypothetical protein
LYFVQFAYRDKKLSGVFCAFFVRRFKRTAVLNMG